MKKVGMILGAMLLLILASSCSMGASTGVRISSSPRKGPPPHAPAHGYRRKHLYRYCPSCYVYFDVHRKLYFYMSDGAWQASVELPGCIHIDGGEAVHLSLWTDRPYIHFNTHKAVYPLGQLKKSSRLGKGIGQSKPKVRVKGGNARKR